MHSPHVPLLMPWSIDRPVAGWMPAARESLLRCVNLAVADNPSSIRLFDTLARGGVSGNSTVIPLRSSILMGRHRS